MTELHRLIAAVVLRQLLLNDIRPDGRSQMVSLAGQIGAGVIVDAIFLEIVIAQIGPEHGNHAQLVRALEGGGDLLYLAARLFGTEIDRGADRHRAHIERLLDAGIERLIVLRRVAQGFVMIQLHHKGNAMRITTRHRRQHAIG